MIGILDATKFQLFRIFATNYFTGQWVAAAVSKTNGRHALPQQPALPPLGQHYCESVKAVSFFCQAVFITAEFATEASAADANLATGGSARDVRMTGTFAPSTIPAAVALMK